LLLVGCGIYPHLKVPHVSHSPAKVLRKTFDTDDWGSGVYNEMRIAMSISSSSSSSGGGGGGVAASD